MSLKRTVLLICNHLGVSIEFVFFIVKHCWLTVVENIYESNMTALLDNCRDRAKHFYRSEAFMSVAHSFDYCLIIV